MNRQEIISNLKKEVEKKGFKIMDREKGKFFAIKHDMRQLDANNAVAELIVYMDYITAEDQMNGKRSRTLTYALLNETRTTTLKATCDGFSLLVK